MLSEFTGQQPAVALGQRRCACATGAACKRQAHRFRPDRCLSSRKRQQYQNQRSSTLVAQGGTSHASDLEVRDSVTGEDSPDETSASTIDAQSGSTSGSKVEGPAAKEEQAVTSRSQETLANLSSLLGFAEDSPAPSTTGPESDPQTSTEDRQGDWWDRPATNQTDAPRRQRTGSGPEGRFLETDDLMQTEGQESRSGQQTTLGSELYDIPLVTPRVAYVMLGLNLAVYGAGVGLALLQGGDASNDYFLALAKVNEAVVAGEYWRLLTANFLHAGLLHLGLNCLALYSLAPDAEAVLGYGTFTAVYLLSGLSGSLASFLFSDAVTVGASGAIFGLLGALGAYFLKNRELKGSTRQILYIAAVAGFNLILGTNGDSMIDNSGHIGGLVAGAWLGWGMGPKFVITRELKIPDGSLTIPEGAEEVEVVIDQTTAWRRRAVLVSFVVSLAVGLAVGIATRSADGLNV
ncbi:hypothetical protein WJX72_006208 [[Myrmecia] bisecta]|uniref:Peptidase S54 rhomboid domain-containing protein n=1 Tax=[Myrmecia] bisecta TaxID=41462 RepID=A0AAW1QF87_9CHLO